MTFVSLTWWPSITNVDIYVKSGVSFDLRMSVALSACVMLRELCK